MNNPELKPRPFCKSKQKALEAYKTQSSGWIPVEKDLPKEWDLVLVMIDQERWPVCARVREGGGRIYFVPDDRDDYLDNEFGTPVLSPTHWQPLPELPKKE